MISVLIPVFNTVIRELVTTLSNQFKIANLPFELCVLDDGSSKEYESLNQELGSAPFYIYNKNDGNLGRLATRQKLAQSAQYPWLLFIDADCLIDNSHFIQQYIDILENDMDLVVGGTAYAIDRPTACNLNLHWLYGSKRIASYTKNASKSKSIYSGFLFNNVLIKKELFLSLSFPSIFKGYGHEDTWVGIQLEKRKAKLLLINNPVLHPQLDEAKLFYEKNINALRNLKQLLTIEEEVNILNHVKIYRYHKFLHQVKCVGIYNCVIRLLKRRIENNLTKCNPSLFSFDLLRLYYLNKILKN